VLDLRRNGFDHRVMDSDIELHAKIKIEIRTIKSALPRHIAIVEDQASIQPFRGQRNHKSS
jgi:hypothetical protein